MLLWGYSALLIQLLFNSVTDSVTQSSLKLGLFQLLNRMGLDTITVFSLKLCLVQLLNNKGWFLLSLHRG